MPITLRHNFQSPLADAGAPNEVGPAEWNEAHLFTMATGKLLGRASAGTGAVEEIDLTTAGRALLDDASAAAQRTTLGLGALATLNSPFQFSASADATSGTAVDFTSIPAVISHLVIAVDGLSTSGTSPVIVQLGDSGGIETAGYSGGAARMEATPAYANLSSGFDLGGILAASARHGVLTLWRRPSTNLWIASGVIGRSDVAGVALVGGSKTLSGALDRVRVTTAGGANTFDGGSITVVGA